MSEEEKRMWVVLKLITSLQTVTSHFEVQDTGGLCWDEWGFNRVMFPDVLSAVLFRCTNVNNMATLLCSSAKLWACLKLEEEFLQRVRDGEQRDCVFSVCSEFYFALFIFKCLKLKVSQWNVFIRFHSPSHISFRKRPRPASLHSSCSSSSCFKVFFVFSWNTVSSPPLSAGRIIVPLD